MALISLPQGSQIYPQTGKETGLYQETMECHFHRYSGAYVQFNLPAPIPYSQEPSSVIHLD